MIPPRFQAVLLLGPTASGKTPLGEMIEREGFCGAPCHHFDFGAELRNAAEGECQTDLTAHECAFIGGLIRSGRLLEDQEFHLARRIFSSFVSRRNTLPGDLIILNGLPRHVGQARMIEEFLRVGAVFVLRCARPEVYGRIEGNTGNDRCGRCDDAPSLVDKKLEIFERRTAPLVKYYRDSGAPIIGLCVNASTETKEMYRQFVSRVPLLRPDAQ